MIKCNDLACTHFWHCQQCSFLFGDGNQFEQYKSNKTYLSTSTSTLCIALFELGNLFCAKYRYISLKYGLFKYPAYISFIVTWRCLPFNTFLSMIFKFLSMSVCFGKFFCTRLLVLIKSANSGGSSN